MWIAGTSATFHPTPMFCTTVKPACATRCSRDAQPSLDVCGTQLS
jgi:hypothetical protein